MNQISDNPGPKNFGHEFNYEQWTADTILTLCNVPWDSEYRDVPAYARDRTQLNDYIDARESPRVSITNATYAKLNVPVRIGATLNQASRYNYIRASNGLQPVTSGDSKRDYYYFIVGIREIAPETTELIVQLDIWCSYLQDIDGVRGYLERGHAGIANENDMQNNGRDYLTIAEGMDVGTDYRTIAIRRNKIMAMPDDYNILGVFITDPEAAPYKLVDGVQQINYTTSKGGTFYGITSGATFYLWENPARFADFMNQNKDTPWISQGLISITLVPSAYRYWPDWNWDGTNIMVNGRLVTGKVAPTTAPTPRSSKLWDNWRTSDLYVNLLGERYKHLNKFKVFPYSAIELTTHTATPIVLKPENWASSDATIIERANVIAPNARIQIAPWRYNAIRSYVRVEGPQGDPLFEDGGDFFDFFTQITGLPSVPIVNDGSILALASQQNSIAFGRQSADWSQQRALTGAQTGYDQATSGMNTTSAMGDISNQNAYRQTQIQQDLARQTALTGMVSGVGGGAGMGAFGGPAGAAAGAIGGGIGSAANLANMGAQFAAQNDMLSQQYSNTGATVGAANQNAGFVRDTNNDLAKFAAKGDYANAIAGINARVADIESTPNSVVGQMGGELINLLHNMLEVQGRWKLIDAAHIRLIGEYWLRYGYAVHQWLKVPDTYMVMERFTYWKMSETYLVGGYFPENIRQGLRGIFEKGVTVWADPNDIGNVNMDIANNAPVAGFVL